MNKTELLNKLARDGEERLLLARVLDKLELARDRSAPARTPFLSPGERAAAEGLIAACGHPRHLFAGGYQGAERTVCLFLPDWQEPEDALLDPPAAALRCSFPPGSGLTHRDFLGAILGLGITREKVGDLLVGEASCDVLVLPELAPFLLANLESAGRVKLKVAEIPLEELAVPQVQVRQIRDTVAALRLDAVMAAGFSLSRGRAAGLIGSGKVQLNHRECLKADRTVAQGDVISCRGLGKCCVKTVGGLSKKGRTMIEMERYI